VLAICRRVLGEEHPHTTSAAWNLISILGELNETEAAVRLVRHDLAWLLRRDAAALSASQQKVRRFILPLAGTLGLAHAVDDSPRAKKPWWRRLFGGG
jgi:hypothetical protein